MAAPLRPLLPPWAVPLPRRHVTALWDKSSEARSSPGPVPPGPPEDTTTPGHPQLAGTADRLPWRYDRYGRTSSRETKAGSYFFDVRERPVVLAAVLPSGQISRGRFRNLFCRPHPDRMVILMTWKPRTFLMVAMAGWGILLQQRGTLSRTTRLSCPSSGRPRSLRSGLRLPQDHVRPCGRQPYLRFRIASPRPLI